MDIVVGNGQGDQGSNNGWVSILHSANITGKGMNSNILLPAMGK